jgi:hypothetical protein
MKLSAHSLDLTPPRRVAVLRVGDREVGHGRVRVRSHVVETPVEERVTLGDERVDVDVGLSTAPPPTPTACSRSAQSGPPKRPRRPWSRTRRG